MNQKNNFFILLLSAMILGSCQNPEVTDISPEFAIPLINSSLSIQDLLDGSNTGDVVQIGGDNFITLTYQKEVISTDTIVLVEIPPFFVPQILPTQTVPTPFPPNFRVEKITVKNSKLYLSFESNNVNNITFNLNIPSIKLGNNQLTYARTITNPTGTIPFTFEDSIDISGYNIIFQNQTFTSEYTATDAVTNLPVILSNYILNFPKVDFSYIEGYLGQDVFVLPTEELLLGFFEQWKSGSVTFTEPKIRLRFDNSYGFPLRVSFDTLQAITRDGGNIDLVTNGFGNGRVLNYPTLSEVGAEERTNVTIDKDNSNIVNVLEQVPYGLKYQFSGQANPTGDPNFIGFATDASKIVLAVIAELPMEGAVQDFTLVDTFNLDLTTDNIPEGEAEFKIIATNGFPLEINLQCYFLDAFGQVVDSMFLDGNSNLMEAAPVDSDGRVTNSVQTITFAGFTRERVNKIRKDVTQIILQGRFNSTDNGSINIKLYADYEVQIQIGVKIKPFFK
jgi:hypothetical protein